MHEPKLTHQERKLLESIEEGLRGDETLDRELRSFGHAPARPGGRWSTVLRRRLGWCTAGLGAVCAALFVLAAVSSSAVPLWCFAAVWVVTAVCLIRLVYVGAGARRRR
ncbi:hypothetical protein [Streptomyces sp. NPDC002057]|uniref:hypothetical protein n=1 Tax=Streptomyces sp. NPDC002057 TaxID=3154664 RepID=UPI00331FB4FA